MENLILGIKSFVIGISAIISAATTPVLIAPTPIPSPTPTPQAQVQKDLVTREGEYSHSGRTLKYSISVPKNGGDITGSFSGVCEGPINGHFAGGEGGNIEGVTQAKCSVAIFSYNLKVDYTGKLYLKEGKVDINWTGEIPYTNNSGSLTLNFEPVN